VGDNIGLVVWAGQTHLAAQAKVVGVHLQVVLVQLTLVQVAVVAEQIQQMLSPVRAVVLAAILTLI
jgi:hypothetical protein